MTSVSTFPQRLTKVDDLSRPDHHYLAADDECYFLGEYSARQSHAYSVTNQLILNFKKKMDRQGRAEWRYKGVAIQQAAAAFRSALKGEVRERVTFVPVPPSKAKNDPLYDDRLVQMLQSIWPGQPTDIRELVIQPVSTDAVHNNAARPSPAELMARYTLDRALLQPAPQMIAVMDDVLTTGCHFVAVRNKLREAFPTTRIVGMFVVRRVPGSIDFEAFDDLEL